MRSSVISVFLSVIIMLSAGCSLLRGSKEPDTPKAGRQPTSDAGQDRWKRLVEILDHYDEVRMVTSDFESRAFLPDGTVKVETGKHVYSKGRSQWVYFDDKGRRVREINCYEDRVEVRLFKYRGRRRKPKVTTKEFPGRYTCALQALVHYTGALQKNRLKKDDKTIIVHDFDSEEGIIRKITLVKNNISTEIVFRNVRLIADEPATEKSSGTSVTSDSTSAQESEGDNPLTDIQREHK